MGFATAWKKAQGPDQDRPPRRELTPADWDREITDVIREFDKAGVIVTEASLEVRRETLSLEDEITEAANAGDAARFRKALHAWRLAWLRSLH